MKKLFKVLGTIATLAVLLLAGCDDLLGSLTKDNPSTVTDTYKPVVYTSYSEDGTKYELTITRTSREVLTFTPAPGDSFKLTITKAGVTKTSTGQITAVTGTTFTLKHTGTGETLSVKVSANSSSGGTMVSITGDIPIDNSTTKAPAPAELTSDPPGDTEPTEPASSSAPDTRLAGTWIAVYEDIVEAGGGAGASYVDENGEVVGGEEGETYEIHGKFTYTLKFITASTFTMDGKMIKIETLEEDSMPTATGTYTVSGSTVVLRGSGMPSDGLSGVINGNKIVFSNLISKWDRTKEDLVFTRQ